MSRRSTRRRTLKVRGGVKLTADVRGRLEIDMWKLAGIPHGPGQTGIVVMNAVQTMLTWLPNDKAIDFLSQVGGRPEWIGQIESCPVGLCPVIITLPSTDMLFAAMPGSMMSRGSQVLS